MKKLSVVFLIFFLITTSCSQIKSISDSEFNRFIIGFDITIYPNQRTQVVIYDQDTVIKCILLDTVVSKQENVVLINGNVYEKEKINYPNKIVIRDPVEKSGIYFLGVNVKEKFVLIK